MFSLTTFAVGFLTRPLGAIFLGAYIDHIGRRRGLLVTLAFMSVGALTIALVPGCATIGLFASILVVLGRLCQGCSAGVVLGGVSVYLSEMAASGHKGFYISWQSGATRWPSRSWGCLATCCRPTCRLKRCRHGVAASR